MNGKSKCPTRRLNETITKMMYKCSFCSESFKSFPKLRAHYILHPVASPFEDTPKSSNDTKQNSCDARSSADTSNQKQKNTRSKSTSTHRNANNKSLSHEKTQANLTVKCSICTRCGCKSYQKNFLKHHKCAFTDDQSFRCVICEKTFVKQFNLNRHIKTHLDKYSEGTHRNANNKSLSHEKTQANLTVKCSICTRCGCKSYQKNLLKHHKCAFTDDQSFRCAICEKTFVKQSNLNRHIKTHLQYSEGTRQTI